MKPAPPTDPTMFICVLCVCGSADVQASLAAAQEKTQREVIDVREAQQAAEAAELAKAAAIERERGRRLAQEKREATAKAQAKVQQRAKEQEVRLKIKNSIVRLVAAFEAVASASHCPAVPPRRLCQVVSILQDSLGGNTLAFAEFKKLSSQFRFGKIDAKVHTLVPSLTALLCSENHNQHPTAITSCSSIMPPAPTTHKCLPQTP